MTRDPGLDGPVGQRAGDARRAADRAAVGVALVAACAAACSLPLVGRVGPSSLHPLDDLLIATPVALAIGLVFWWLWPGVMRATATGRWHRANGLLLVGPTAAAATFFALEFARLAWRPWVSIVLAATVLAVVSGGAARWVLAVARAETRGPAGGRAPGDPARMVALGLAGFVTLLVGLGVARNIEYLARMEALRPIAALLDDAGRQRMLAQQVGRVAARAAAGEVGADAIAAALATLSETGERLDAALARAALPVRENDAAAAARDARAALRRSVAAAVRPGATASGPINHQGVQQAVDDAVAAAERLVAALRAYDTRQADELQRTAVVGFVLLALAGALGGTAVVRGISRVVRAQQRAILAAAADQDRLARVVRNTANVVVMTDVQGRITWVNAAFERLTGYGLPEARGRTPGSLLQCEDTDPATIARVGAAIRAVEPVRVEILNRDRAGNRYWIDLLIEPQFGDDGRHTGFLAIESDITETVVLRERHRAFFAAMPVGVVVQDEGGAVVECNDAACRMLGLDADHLRGRTSIDPRWRAVREDGSPLPGEEHYSMRTLRSGEVFEDQVLGVHTPGGALRWLSVSTRLIPGSRIGCREVVATFIDITERRATAELVTTERARMSAALEATRAGVWHWRIAEGVVDTDAGWSRIIGEQPAAPGQVPIGDWMRRLHPDDADLATAAADLHLHGVTDHYDAELRVRHHDGHWIWVHCRGRLTERDPDGRARSMFGTLIDISARKSASQAVESEQHKLRSLFELAPVGVALARADDGVLLECNGMLCRMLGRQPGELVGRNLRDFTPDEHLAEWESRSATFPATGTVGPYEKAYLRADGTPVPVLVSVQRVPLADGTHAMWIIVQDMSERKALEEGLQLEARTDKLTGLANRGALVERLDAAVAQARADARSGFGLLFLDFDRFKLVNDTLGHDAGDELLRQIAERLRRCLRTARGDAANGTFVARIGGDEFVVLVGGTSDVVEIERVARRLLGALAAPYAIRGSDVQSSASIGVVSSAQCELDTSAILRDADTAMYEAKRRGRGVSVVFDEGMRSRLRRQVEVERNLRRAIPNRELVVVYQPIVDLETGQVSSIEALLRWSSAELGEVSPSEFIPIAEDSGQIVDIGAWVLAESCRGFAAWCAAHPGSQATVSVNLSRVQLGQPDLLLATVERVLEDSGLPAWRLQLEVTERDVMRDPAAVLLLMRHLRALGVRLAMDDFGTGTSSLACLRDYPFDVIKIDRGFVGDLGTNGQVLALVHATMMLIENLGMTSVAEGVETTAQAAILQSVGCRLAQGWLFGAPGALPGIDGHVLSAA